MTLIAKDVTKAYETRSDPLVILRGVTFELPAGTSAAILGPSGSGKSTLLQILGTLQRPSSGSVTLAGTDPFAMGEAQLAEFRNQQVGFIFQDHHLLPQLTALENVLVPVLAQRRPDEATIARAKDLLDRVGLSHRLDHRPAELSGGERQRVAIARALINQPQLLLADEPTGNLDRTNAQQIADVLQQVRGDGTQQSLVVVTHSMELAQRFDHQWQLDDGKLEL